MAKMNANTIVIDNGSYKIKAGFSNDERPSYEFPSMIGVLREHFHLEKFKEYKAKLKDYYVGQEASAKRGILCLYYPIDKGIITNWDQMEKLWHHTIYNELRATPEDHSILLTESPLNTKTNRERMTEIMFETFSFPAVYVSNPASLALHASGDTTGIVMDAGYGGVNFVPIVEGNVLSHAVQQMEFGGRQLADYLMRILFEAGADFHSALAILDLRDIMAKLCFVACDFEQAMSDEATGDVAVETSMTNGEIIRLNTERFRCPELLFKPHLANLESTSIQENIVSCVSKCDTNIQKELFANIVLAGGCSSFPGIVGRLKTEVAALAPTATVVNVKSSPEPKYSAWAGGAMLAALPSLNWITKREYEEFGAEIVHRKCAQ